MERARRSFINQRPSDLRKKAEAAGVDVVSVVGFECGGAPGNDDVTSMVLVPSVASAVHIPVIGGGGVCDGRSYLAMRALGSRGRGHRDKVHGYTGVRHPSQL